MTCIVGVKEGGKIWMGADSAASALPASEIYTVAAPKIFIAGEYLVGYTISFRAGQVLQHQVEWPSPPDGIELDRWVVREIVPALRRALRDGGALKIEAGVEQSAHFIIGIRGELFSVAMDFSLVAMPEPYMAIGSGRHHAYGALHALAGFQLPPEVRVRKALEAATTYSCNVRPPFAMLSTP